MKNILLGVACLDIYTQTGILRPGCGILHNAFHLRQLGSNPLLITRIGREHAETFLQFFRKNHISILADSIIGNGPSASIEINVQPAGEARMANYVMGVWQDFCLTPPEEAALSRAEHLHLVLADGVAPEFLRVSRAGMLGNALVSADFLSFRGFTPESFAGIFEHLDIAFIGWKGNPADPAISAIRQLAGAKKALVVITLGERGILVFNSLTPASFQSKFYEVDAVAVQGNTNGCGDAFISHFLAEYWRSQSLEQAINRGKFGGERATQWHFALPKTAYCRTNC